MMNYSDYDTGFDDARHDPRSEEEWERVWNTNDRPVGTRRKIELGLTVIAATVALVVLRSGWLRTARPPRIVPSAADIHVRPPPPR